jgi:excisionase family DNA binding protein
MTNKSERLLTITGAAELLSIKVSRLRTAVFRKEIPFIKIGRLVRFKESDLMKWVESRTQKEKRSILDDIFN